MPELPEVETIVRELKSSAIGKKIWRVETLWEPVFQPSSGVVEKTISGLRVTDVRRRGKYILFALTHGWKLGIHLRMTGRLLWNVHDVRNRQHVRAVFSFTDATKLYFSDARKFGRIFLFSEDNFEHKKCSPRGFQNLGIEPFSEDFTVDYLHNLQKGKKGSLKAFLLRQDLIAGIGNIYADEICFAARKHPLSRVEHLSEGDIARLYVAIQSCLQEGIQHCGVSLSDFVGTRGELGKHQAYLKIYGRKDDPCYECGSVIQKTRVAGRGTFFCPDCQTL